MVYNFTFNRKIRLDGEEMVQEKKAVYKCRCRNCATQPDSELALSHASINHLVATFNEKQRRQFVGFLASHLGHGGIKNLSKITGLSQKTVSRGKKEVLGSGISISNRIRIEGGGRHKVEKKKLIY